MNIKDLEKLSIKPEQLSKLSENDRNKAINLLSKDFIKEKEPELKDQVSS